MVLAGPPNCSRHGLRLSTTDGVERCAKRWVFPLHTAQSDCRCSNDRSMVFFKRPKASACSFHLLDVRHFSPLGVTFDAFFAADPAWSWQYWDRCWKTIFLGFFAAAMTTTKVRVHALGWVMVISLFQYGVKGGVFKLLSSGSTPTMTIPTTSSNGICPVR